MFMIVKVDENEHGVPKISVRRNKEIKKEVWYRWIVSSSLITS